MAIQTHFQDSLMVMVVEVPVMEGVKWGMGGMVGTVMEWERKMLIGKLLVGTVLVVAVAKVLVGKVVVGKVLVVAVTSSAQFSLLVVHYNHLMATKLWTSVKPS